MYFSGCTGCNGRSRGLGQLTTYYSDPLSGGGFGTPWPGPTGFELQTGGLTPSRPSVPTFGFDVGDFFGGVWNEVKSVLGDVAGDLSREVVDWIQRRIGREAWEQMPEASRREAIRAATEDLQVRGVGVASSVLPWLAVGLAAYFLLAPRRGR